MSLSTLTTSLNIYPNVHPVLRRTYPLSFVIQQRRYNNGRSKRHISYDTRLPSVCG